MGDFQKVNDNNQQTDLAITIGDSSIKLPCDENGLLNDNDAKSNISVSLIKANRTKSQIVMSTVSVKDMMSMPVEPEITMMVMLKTDEVVALLDSTMKDFLKNNNM